MRTDFSLITLGRLALEAHDGAGVGGLDRQRRKLAVLAVLALTRTPVSRDLLLEMFWGEQDETRARHSLSDALSHLRRVLGPAAISARHAEVALAPDVPLRVDALELADAVRAGDDERVIQLWGGRFLDAVYVGGSPRFEQWVEREARRLDGLFRGACARRCQVLAAAGEWSECERVARRWLDSDPLAADAALALLSAVSGDGSRASLVRAVAEYASYRRELERELDEEPDATVGAFAETLQARLSERTPATSAPPPAPFAPPPFAPSPASSATATAQPAPEPRRDDASSRSRRIRSKPVVWAGAATVALAVLVAIGLWLRPAPDAPTATVAIVPFAVHGGADFGFLREGMVDLLSTNLDGTAGLRTVDPRAVLAAAAALGTPASTPGTARELAIRLGAATYVTGDIVEAGGRLRISAALYQVQRGLEPVSRAYAEGAADSLFAVVDALTVALVADRVQRLGGRLARIAALTTSSIPALKAYLEGERHWRALRLVEAVDALRTATRHDTAFALAWYRLGMASSWDAKVDVAQEAMERAMRHSAALSERDRTLIAAYNDVVRRDPESAERRYRAVVADYPTDVEAWAGLGEMWFHANPWRGRSFEESREAWEHVLRLEPHNVGATWHLAYVSARQGRGQELDTLTSRIRTTVDGGADLSVRAMRAVALGGTDEQDALIAELARADDFTMILAVWRVAVFTEDLDETARFAQLLVQPRRPPEVRALGHGLLAHLHLARGQLKTADAALDSLALLDPVQALEYRALFATFPLHPASRDSLEVLRTTLRTGHATPAPRRPIVADLWVNVHTDIHPQLRTYLLGLLSARLGERGGAEHSAALLEAATGDFDATSLALSQSRGIRAEQQHARGRTDAALALLESSHDRVDFGTARVSPFFARSRQRFMRAELLHAAGRDDEALGWYRGLGEIYPHDVVYLAPAYLRRAQIHAERGDTAIAADYFRRFLALWKDSDPELRRWTDDARQRLALLTGQRVQRSGPVQLTGQVQRTGQRVQRTVAFTFDDLPVISTTRDTAVQWSVTRGILRALRAADAPAIGFVNEEKLGDGAARDARTRMLQAWLDAGHDLGNHSYSHPDLNTTPLAVYTADIARGEEVTRSLRGARPTFFRHPFLHAGNDSTKKAGLDRFLSDNGYRVAPVTIDNQDWVFARAYDLAIDADDNARARRIADAYVVYMDTVFGFYEAQSRAIVGREIPQVLLLHANRINRDLLDELLAMARRRGYAFVTLEEALRDPAYDRSDGYIGPAGIAWLHRWAITDGLDRSIFRGEPEVPALVAGAVN